MYAVICHYIYSLTVVKRNNKGGREINEGKPADIALNEETS
jgi:hypothetical protein